MVRVESQIKDGGSNDGRWLVCSRITAGGVAEAIRGARIRERVARLNQQHTRVGQNEDKLDKHHE
jgi:hypothetical protein|eukprot:5535999-Prymnesium_polylepis.1